MNLFHWLLLNYISTYLQASFIFYFLRYFSIISFIRYRLTVCSSILLKKKSNQLCARLHYIDLFISALYCHQYVSCVQSIVYN